MMPTNLTYLALSPSTRITKPKENVFAVLQRSKVMLEVRQLQQFSSFISASASSLR
jgi:hypothetical protein